mgnify:CR=1 FL=1
MGVSSTQVGDHWGSARTVQPNFLLPSVGVERAVAHLCVLLPPLLLYSAERLL